jgi:transposase InsO family protein
MSDEALTAAIRAVLAASPFHGEGHRKVWARLRHGGIRTSRRRVLRLMRAYDLLAPTRVGTPRGPRSHDGTIIPETVDTMWGTDLTTTVTGEGQAAVFVAVDHCSAECVGIHAHARATRFEALEPIRQGVRQRFGGFAKGLASGLAVRHDHGSQYMSDHFQKEIAFLGIESSPAFVRAPEGNGCAERFIRTLKENLLWIRTFETIEELRQALLAFRDTYNTTWLIERHGFITPEAFRQKQLQAIPEAA